LGEINIVMNMDMIITNGKIIRNNEILRGQSIIIENGIIRRIGRITNNSSCNNIYDAGGNYVCPGMVDIHTHGANGNDYMDASVPAFNNILSYQAKNGVTSSIASTVSDTEQNLLKVINVAREYRNSFHNGAKLLGLHLEGPFLSQENRGAHNEKNLKIPKPENYGFMLENSDILKMVTISPELENAANFTKDAVNRGIVVALGHDDAASYEIEPVIEAGASHLTHIYCAMSGVGFRNGKRYAGLREYGLVCDKVTCEVIADMRHLPVELIKLIYRAKGADMMCCVSDSVRITGLPEDGTIHTLGANDESSPKIIAKDGVALLADGSKYAGSITTLNGMLKNLVFLCGIPLVDAVNMVTLIPARIINEDTFIGSVDIGKHADFCILNDNLDIVDTIINGKLYDRR